MKQYLTNDEKLHNWLEQIELKDAIWKEVSDGIYQNKLQLTDPVLVNINHVRQLFRFYLIPLIREIEFKNDDEQTRSLRFLDPVIAAPHLDQFLEHFFAVQITKVSETGFQLRDPFLEDLFVLYDLFKSKIIIKL
ncbi:MAG: hypothetical protein GY786_04375, partial [Proteobacteria bacterium]|nr:hypothetical protein [Pseudomonadota bacterium]